MDQITIEISVTKVIKNMELEQSLKFDNLLFGTGMLNFNTYYFIFIITTPNNVTKNFTTENIKKLYTYNRVFVR